ncbi:uncharacterized protein LOC132204460 isoform X3 [Neocloeon triangulifer]|nr:uncharacterized protein LOC132204460 isoform X3 [Neocloeon triangulifer]
MDISFNNVYWQVQKMTNDIYYLFGAYFDNRKLNGVGPVVRVMGLLQHWEPKVKPFCQMWFNNQTTPVITQVFSFNMLWNHFWGPEANIMQPYFITCKVPPSMNGSVPVAVSVVEQPCENATNLLRVIYDPLPPGQEQKDFAVCAKGLFYKHNPNMAVRIVEWVELLKILGAEKIGLYYYHIHENITKVFNYYEESGFMDVGQVTVPGKYPNAPDLVAGFLETHRRFEFILEVIHYTDCMYHKMYRYKFIAILDVDEVIVPHSANTWREMLFQKVFPRLEAKAKNSSLSYAAFAARNAYFIDQLTEQKQLYPDIPQYLHMLQNVHRNSFIYPAGYQPGYVNVKCFHNPQHVLVPHNHYPIYCFNDVATNCTKYDFDLGDALLHHYCTGRSRTDCETTDTTKMVIDASIWRYKEKLIQRTTEVLVDIGIIGRKDAIEHFDPHFLSPSTTRNP